MIYWLFCCDSLVSDSAGNVQLTGGTIEQQLAAAKAVAEMQASLSAGEGSDSQQDISFMVDSNSKVRLYTFYTQQNLLTFRIPYRFLHSPCKVYGSFHKSPHWIYAVVGYAKMTPKI